MFRLFSGLRRRIAALGSVVLFGLHSGGVMAIPVIDPAVSRALMTQPMGTHMGAFLHFDGRFDPAMRDWVRAQGLNLVSDYAPWADVVFATGTVGQFAPLRMAPQLRYIEENRELQFFGDTGPWATRVRVAQEPVAGGPYRDAQGRILLGQGIGVGVIDSGINALHPDLVNRVGRNYKIECLLIAPSGLPDSGCAFIDVGRLASTDAGGGHGTHVSGIVGGDGSASTGPYPVAEAAPNIRGSFTGVAPGATIHSFSTGEGINIFWATQSVKYILDHYDSFEPRIRVTNHSYGQVVTGAESAQYNPNSIESQLHRALATEKDVVMVFAAGNDGGDGTARRTSPTCQDPTPGIICAANYDDGGTGTRNGGLSSSSSRGRVDQPNSYPDLSAPGTNITASCGVGAGAICQSAETQWAPHYGTITGTSMAAPHIAGAVALIRQARPDLTAGQVERLLQNTAHKIGNLNEYIPDSQNPGGTHHFAFGAGLLDLQAALEALGVAKDGEAPVGPFVVLDGHSDTRVAGAADVRRLTVQEVQHGGEWALEYGLTVRDANDLGGADAVLLQVLGLVDGRRVSTAVRLSGSGVTAEPQGGRVTAAATAVTREGNLIRFIVPLGRMGAPEPGSPYHNIHVQSFFVDGNTVSSASRTPRSGSRTEATEPMFGRAFLITRASVADEGSVCEIPGVTLLTDPEGDSLTTSDQDLLSASLAQPFQASGNPLLVFTLKVAQLETLTPGSDYYISFQIPGGGFRGVRMRVTNPMAPTFFAYTPAPSSGGIIDGRFVTAGSEIPAQPGSGFTPEGTITIIVRPQDVGVTPGELLSGFNAGVTQSTNPGNLPVPTATAVTDEMPDGLGRVGSFLVRSNHFCAPNTPPTAVLSASPLAGTAPLTVTLDASGSSDADGDALTYRFDSGHGSVVEQSEPLVQFTYPQAGSFTASVVAIDARGAESTPATQGITVTAAGGGTDPTPTPNPGLGGVIVARLAASPQGGNVPLTVRFDASASTYENGTAINGARYTFILGNGDEIGPQPGPVATYTYEAAGTFQAFVRVEDVDGNFDDSERITIEPTITIGVEPGDRPDTDPGTVAQLTVDRASGQVPLTVTFDGSRSRAAPGRTITLYRFDFGDGSPVVERTSPVVTHTYRFVGTFQPRLTVVDSDGATAFAEARVLVVPQDPSPAPSPGPTPPPSADDGQGSGPGGGVPAPAPTLAPSPTAPVVGAPVPAPGAAPRQGGGALGGSLLMLLAMAPLVGRRRRPGEARS